MLCKKSEEKNARKEEKNGYTRLDKKVKWSQNGGNMEKRPRRTFTEEFKKQMVELYNAGKPRAEIVREYDLVPSA